MKPAVLNYQILIYKRCENSAKTKSTMVSYQTHRADLCKDYKKDIFGRFAYDFELSQNILSFLI